MSIGFKKVTRTFDAKTGEKLVFTISNNGNKKWAKVDAETKEEAIKFLDNCAKDIKRLQTEIRAIKGNSK